MNEKKRYWVFVPLNDDDKEPAEDALQRAYAFIYKDVRPSIPLKSAVKEAKRKLETEGLNKEKVEVAVVQEANSTDTATVSPKLPPSDVLDEKVPNERKKKPGKQRETEFDEEERNREANWTGTVPKTELLNWIQSGAVLNIVELLKKKTAKTRTITVFLSSPFDGLEDERSIFREAYATQLEDICAKKGFMLKMVRL